MNDFSGYPKSIAEKRADKAGDGRLWTPRDLLIALLREIDEGDIKAEHMVVCFDRSEEREGRETRLLSYRAAGVRSRHEAVGLIEATKGFMMGWDE